MLSKQAGYVIIIKPEQRTGIKMRLATCCMYMKRRMEINSLFSVLIIPVRISLLSALLPSNLSLRKETVLLNRITVIVEM